MIVVAFDVVLWVFWIVVWWVSVWLDCCGLLLVAGFLCIPFGECFFLVFGICCDCSVFVVGL